MNAWFSKFKNGIIGALIGGIFTLIVGLAPNELAEYRTERDRLTLVETTTAIHASDIAEIKKDTKHTKIMMSRLLTALKLDTAIKSDIPTPAELWSGDIQLGMKRLMK